MTPQSKVLDDLLNVFADQLTPAQEDDPTTLPKHTFNYESPPPAPGDPSPPVSIMIVNSDRLSSLSFSHTTTAGIDTLRITLEDRRRLKLQHDGFQDTVQQRQSFGEGKLWQASRFSEH